MIETIQAARPVRVFKFWKIRAVWSEDDGSGGPRVGYSSGRVWWGAPYRATATARFSGIRLHLTLMR